jgi:hypothetical protein
VERIRGYATLYRVPITIDLARRLAALQLRGTMTNDILFKVVTILGCSVRVTRAYWELIVTVKHPVMRGCEVAVQSML